MRLFIAINLTSGMKRALLSGADSLRAQVRGGSFTPAENMHLTLAFIGESERAHELARIVEKTAPPPFELALGEPGRFGDLWWAGLRPCAELEALAKNLRRELLCAGFEQEKRAFRAHITLARRVRTEEPPQIVLPPAKMTVRRISLMKSDLGGGRAKYTEIFGKDL